MLSTSTFLLFLRLCLCISAAPRSINTTNATCPTSLLAGSFKSPYLTILTSSEQLSHVFGSSPKSYISPINTTISNFNTSPYNGTCALLFFFPYASDLAASGTYYFSGIEEEEGEHGGLDFAMLSGLADTTTTYNSTPAVATDYGKTEILPGNNYTIATFDCQSGVKTAAGTMLSISGNSAGNVELDYTQNSLPSPIGLYVVPCS